MLYHKNDGEIGAVSSSPHQSLQKASAPVCLFSNFHCVCKTATSQCIKKYNPWIKCSFNSFLQNANPFTLRDRFYSDWFLVCKPDIGAHIVQQVMHHKCSKTRSVIIHFILICVIFNAVCFYMYLFVFVFFFFYCGSFVL